MQRHDDDSHRDRATRRDVLRFGALALVAGACGTLPAAPARGAIARATLSPALGYWTGGAALASFQSVRAGWLPACASRAEACAGLHDELVAASTDAASGALRLRVLGMAHAARAGSLRLQAVFGGEHAHELWSARTDSRGTAVSSPVAMRFDGDEPPALRLVDSHGRNGTVTLPARPGVYVLLPDVRGPFAPWRGLALREVPATRAQSLTLVRRADGAAYNQPYLLLAVDRRA